jgi:hypothetical protein
VSAIEENADGSDDYEDSSDEEEVKEERAQFKV